MPSTDKPSTEHCYSERNMVMRSSVFKHLCLTMDCIWVRVVYVFNVSMCLTLVTHESINDMTPGIAILEWMGWSRCENKNK